MSPSADPDAETVAPGEGLAIAAESLYLANLLLAPGLAFAALLWMYLSRRREASPLAAAHLDQTVSASVWAGILLIGVNGAILLVGGYDGPNVWTVVIVYFTVFHSTFVLLGTSASPRRWPGSAGAIRSSGGRCRRGPNFQWPGKPATRRERSLCQCHWVHPH